MFIHCSLSRALGVPSALRFSGGKNVRIPHVSLRCDGVPEGRLTQAGMNSAHVRGVFVPASSSGLSGGSLPFLRSQGVKTMRCDKGGLSECCGNLERLVLPGGVEVA